MTGPEHQAIEQVVEAFVQGLREQRQLLREAQIEQTHARENDSGYRAKTLGQPHEMSLLAQIRTLRERRARAEESVANAILTGYEEDRPLRSTEIARMRQDLGLPGSARKVSPAYRARLHEAQARTAEPQQGRSRGW